MNNVEKKIVGILVGVYLLIVSVVLGIAMLVIIPSLNKEIENLKSKYAKEIDELKEKNRDLLDTAFYLKDFLASDYYVTDAKKFERFVLISGKYVLVESEKWKVEKRNRMNKEELRKYLEISYAGGKLYGIDPYLLVAIDGVESKGFNKRAKSKVGALGVCQFMPYTARMVSCFYTPYEELRPTAYGKEKLFDPVYSKKLQVLFLYHLFETFDGRIEWVLLAYNVGPQYVLKYYWNDGNMRFADLNDEDKRLVAGKRYVNNVLNVYTRIKKGEI